MLIDQCDGTLRYSLLRISTSFLRRVNGGFLGWNPTSTTYQLFNKLLKLSVLLWEYKCINTHKGLEHCLAIVSLKEVLTVLNIIKMLIATCSHFISSETWLYYPKRIHMTEMTDCVRPQVLNMLLIYKCVQVLKDAYSLEGKLWPT